MNEQERVKLPVLTRENLSGIMAKRLASTRNAKTSIPALWQGLLEMDVACGGDTRTALLYVPKDTPQGTSFVLLNIPEGETALGFLRKSGWVDLADSYGICIFAAEPGVNGWSSPDEEYPFLKQCLQAIFDGVYIRGGMGLYIVGYGEIGCALHRLAMENPLKVAAAAFYNASNIDEAYIHGLEAMRLDEEDRAYAMKLTDVPVPVLILESRSNAAAKCAAVYWAGALGAENSTESAPANGLYCQQKRSVCTPEGNIACVAYRETRYESADVDLTVEICSFLMRYVRFGKEGPYGNTLVLRPDYHAIGVEFLHFQDAKGNLRECLVYVPKAWRDKGKLPLVFGIHGSFESVRNYFEESQWYRKADREGFIVAIPEGILKPIPPMLENGMIRAYRALYETYVDSTGTSDLDFINGILDEIIARYPVDETRMYCTGHSMGCMMTNFACSSFLGRRFAAAAGTSGMLGDWDPSGAERVPIYMTMGEYDLWSCDLHEDSLFTRAIDQWIVRNGLAPKARAKQVRTGAASEKCTQGRYECYVWKNACGVPMLRYDCVRKKDHMNTPEENFRFWDLWFSKWTLDPEKGRCYEGAPIGCGTANDI